MPAPSALGPVGRRWGDGSGDGLNPLRARHVIAEIRYEADGRSWLQCATDGEVLEADTPEQLANRWQWHGGKVMAAYDFAPTEPDADDRFLRSRDAIAALALMGARCTCKPGSDITACPNYQPGDEEVDDDD